DVSEADWLRLEAWLAADARHLEAYEEAEGLWAALGSQREAIRLRLDAGPVDNLVELGARRATRRTWRPWALAAAPMAAAVVAGLLLIGPALDRRVVTYQTAPGETRDIVLKDGTRIAMNGGSRLTVQLTGDVRRVKMDQAQAAFDVAHDSDRPFLIDVGESQVRVIGTAFDIRRDETTTRVSVSRGVVQVSDLQTPSRAVRLTVGQSVARDDATDTAVISSVDPAAADGWRQGRLTYQDRPLAEVATDLGRAFGTPVVVSAGAADLRFTGVLELDDERRVIARLEAFLPVTATRANGQVRLDRRPD
nr:FecR domain-containing protein [Brevundimonas sp.]